MLKEVGGTVRLAVGKLLSCMNMLWGHQWMITEQALTAASRSSILQEVNDYYKGLMTRNNMFPYPPLETEQEVAVSNPKSGK